MTTTDTAPRAAAPALDRTHAALAVSAGVALLLGPALFFAGLATSPVQDGEDKVSYIASLMRDPALTQLSAVLLHFGNMLMGLGVLGLPWLVRGTRGAVLAVLGALLASIALLCNSGALFADWMHLELGRQLGAEAGARVSAAVYGHLPFQLSFNLSPLIAVGLLLAVIGLLRAGVIGWWGIPAVVLGQLGLLFLPYDMPLLPALGVLPLLAVLVVGGLRVLGRVRTAAVRGESA